MSLFIKKYHIGKQDLNLNLTLNLPGLTTCQIKCMSLFIRKYNIGKQDLNLMIDMCHIRL